jgi:hypothetical protein
MEPASKVRKLSRVATPETEERLLAVSRTGTAHHVERIVRGWRRMDAKAEAREARLQHARRGLQAYPDEDRTVRIRGRLTPRGRGPAPQGAGRRPGGALPAAAGADAGGRSTDHGAAAGRCPGAAGRERPAPGAGPRSSGRAVPGGRPRGRRRPGGRRVAGPVGPGGRAARSSWNVAAAGVRHHPGGDAPRRRGADRGGRRPDAHDPAGVTPGAPQPRPRVSVPGVRIAVRPGHHIRHWAQGGPTTLSNPALLCRRHHRAVHEGGFQVERLPDGELHFLTPRGWVVPEVPTAPPVPDDPVQASERGTRRNGWR